MADRYTLLQVSGHMMVCNDCGALVRFVKTHDKWHADNDIKQKFVEEKR